MATNPNQAFKSNYTPKKMMIDAQRTEINHRLVKNGITWVNLSMSVFGHIKNDLMLSYDDAALALEQLNAWGAQ